MRIDGEAKDKLYSIMADAIDLGRVYESAITLLKAEKDQSAELMDEADELRNENARLKDRCDVLERSFGDTAALEHTISQLQERNDALKLRLDVISSKPGGNWKKMYDIARHTLGDVESDTNWLLVLDNRLGQLVETEETEPPPATSHQPKRDEWAYLLQENIKLDHKLFECRSELERYKAAVVALRDAVNRYVTTETFVTIQSKAIEYLKEVGYDIEHEEGQEVPEIAAPVGSEDSTAGADEHDFL